MTLRHDRGHRLADLQAAALPVYSRLAHSLARARPTRWPDCLCEGHRALRADSLALLLPRQREETRSWDVRMETIERRRFVVQYVNCVWLIVARCAQGTVSDKT